MDITRPKEYPLNYPEDAVAILDKMSFTKGRGVHLVGSMSLRSQQYAADYDAWERVNVSESTDSAALDALAARFKDIIKDLRATANVFIGDIKAGEVPEWKVIPDDALIRDGKVVGFNESAIRRRINELVAERVITEGEAKEFHSLVRDITPVRLAIAKASIKVHTIRWTPEEVLAGKKQLRDGRSYTLQEAFSSPAMTKMDVIGYVENNRYTDFSIIYEFYNNGRRLNPFKEDIESSLEEDILFYQHEGNWVKALKREFVLAKLHNDKETLERLTDIFNSDVGRLYQVRSDVKTLLDLLENHKGLDDKKIRFEMDQFKRRLSNVYKTDSYLKAEHDLLGELNAALKSPKTKLEPALRRFGDHLESVINGLRGGSYQSPSVGRLRELVGGLALKHHGSNPAICEQWKAVYYVLPEDESSGESDYE